MVHDPGLPGDILGRRNPLVLGLVREHRAGNDISIAHTLGTAVRNSWSVSIWPRLLSFSPMLSSWKPVGVGPPPDRDEHCVGLDRQTSSPLAGSTVEVALRR